MAVAADLMLLSLSNSLCISSVKTFLTREKSHESHLVNLSRVARQHVDIPTDDRAIVINEATPAS